MQAGQIDIAAYIAETCRELRELAEQAKMPILAHINQLGDSAGRDQNNVALISLD